MRMAYQVIQIATSVSERTNTRTSSNLSITGMLDESSNVLHHSSKNKNGDRVWNMKLGEEKKKKKKVYTVRN